jgi:hypothetical protein
LAQLFKGYCIQKKNLEVDLVDLEYNYEAHTIASESIKWVSENNNSLLSYPKEIVVLKLFINLFEIK